MKIPPKSKAAKLLAGLTKEARRERRRCALEAYILGQFCYLRWPDQPAQWIRCEELFKSILRDPLARFDFTNGEKA